LPSGLKVRRAAVTPRPRAAGRAYAFPERLLHVCPPLFVSGSPESRTQRHPVISRVRATGPRLPCSKSQLIPICCRVRAAHPEQRRHGGRPDMPSLCSGMCHPLPTSVSFRSGRQDSNLRSCVPRTHGFAATLHPVSIGAAVQLPPQRMSERTDLNRRSPGPRPGAIPRLRYVLFPATRTGVEPVLLP
jgi:hypothetical protein